MAFYINTTPFLAFNSDTSGSVKVFKMTEIDISANTQKETTTSSVTVWGVKVIVQAGLGIYIGGDI